MNAKHDKQEQESTDATDAETSIVPVNPAEPTVSVDEGGETGVVVFNGIPLPITFTHDPAAIQQDIIRRLMEATTLSEAFDVWEGDRSKALIGRTFIVNGAEWDTYRIEDGSLVPLAIVDSVNVATGEQERWTTTASNLVGWLAWIELYGQLTTAAKCKCPAGEREKGCDVPHFPFTARVNGEKTRRGFTALRFATP